MVLSNRIKRNPSHALEVYLPWPKNDTGKLRQKSFFFTFKVVLLIMCALALALHRVFIAPAAPTNVFMQTEGGIINLDGNKPQEQRVEKKGLEEQHKDLSVRNCALEGSMDPPAESIVIDFAKINGIDKGPLESVKDYTKEEYIHYLLSPAGMEHYSFLNYISATYGDCRHFTDIGTRHVTSALAIGSNKKSPVWTFDLPNSRERHEAFRGKTEEEWQKKVREVGVDITFYNLDLIKISDAELKQIIGTWFIMLDTYHQPDTSPFEREFFQRIIDISYKGILVLDDIRLNDEMKKWWKEVQDNAEKGGYKTYDVTKVGHYSGTGLVDFSGKVMIKE